MNKRARCGFATRLRPPRAGLLRGGLLLLLVCPLPGFAAPTAAAIEKALVLVDHYLQSDSAVRIRASGNENAIGLLDKTVSLYQEARTALEAGDVETADTQVKLALRSYSGAVSGLRSRKTDPAAAKKNAALVIAIDSYRQSFMEGLKEKGPEFVHLLDVARLDSLIDKAAGLTTTANHGDARRALDEAYQLAIAAVTRLRQNETLVYGLEFRTPADEYRYEQERHRSYILLVEQMRAAGRGQGMTATVLEKYLDTADQLTEQGRTQAESGDYEQAIKTMEEANRNMVRALQMMGLEIPG